MAQLLAIVAAESTPLTSTSFEEHVAHGYRAVFVLFHSPECKHCTAMAAAWEALAEQLSGAAMVATVDCVAETPVCSQEAIEGYPTLLFYAANRAPHSPPVEHRGARTVSALAAFIHMQFESAAASPTRLKMHNGVVVATVDTYREAVSGLHAFVKFFAPWCGHCKTMAPAWEALGQTFAANPAVGLRIVEVDCTVLSDLCRSMGITGYPTLLWFEKGSKVDHYKGARTEDALRDYATLKASIPAPAARVEWTPAPAPVVKENGVFQLTAANFGALTSAQPTTFVLFCVSWSTACADLRRVFQQLASEFVDNEQIAFAVTDCEAQAAGFCDEHGAVAFPTILFFENGRDRGKYSGRREFEPIYTWVVAQLANNKPAEPALNDDL